MPRKSGRTSIRTVAALAAFGAFAFAASAAQAVPIGGNFAARISVGNGSYVAHQIVTPTRVPPNVNHPPGVRPNGHPHGGGVK